MNQQHTPGPWKAETFAGKINVWPISKRKADGSAIAYDATDADARLIAAAPDMLAALILMCRSRGSVQPIPPDSAYEAAYAAIAKAEGAAS